MKTLSNRLTNKGFTLIELIVVIAIIGILFTFTVPAVSSAIRANKITSAANTVLQNFAQAQQLAMRENASIQARFFIYDDPRLPPLPGQKQKIRAYQFFRKAANDPNLPPAQRIEDEKNPTRPATELFKLPEGLVVSTNEVISSIMKNLGDPQDYLLPIGRTETIKASYVAFEFTPSGGTNLRTRGDDQYFFTMLDEVKDTGTGDPPDNFATVQIDPYNGTVKLYRP